MSLFTKHVLLILLFATEIPFAYSDLSLESEMSIWKSARLYEQLAASQQHSGLVPFHPGAMLNCALNGGCNCLAIRP